MSLAPYHSVFTFLVSHLLYVGTLAVTITPSLTNQSQTVTLTSTRDADRCLIPLTRIYPGGKWPQTLHLIQSHIHIHRLSVPRMGHISGGRITCPFFSCCGLSALSVALFEIGHFFLFVWRKRWEGKRVCENELVLGVVFYFLGKTGQC